MKKETKRRLNVMLTLLKRKKAYFLKQDGVMYYTYPKYGWNEEMKELQQREQE